MNKETLKKAMQLQKEIKDIQQALKSLNGKGEISIRERRYGCYDVRYDFVTDVDDELKEIIKNRLVAKKEKLEKELEEL